MEKKAEMRLYIDNKHNRGGEEEKKVFKEEDMEEEKQINTNVEDDEEMKGDYASKKRKNDDFDELSDKQTIREFLGENSVQLRVEAEVILKIHIEVSGKGKDYSGSFEFNPHDILESLKAKVPFFKTFIQRSYKLVDKDSGKIIEDFKKEFIDYDLKSGSNLELREIRGLKDQ